MFRDLIFIAVVISNLIFSNVAIARDISIVTVEWEPHFGPNLPQKGKMSALTAAAFKAAGHNPTISFIPWPRAMKEVLEGKSDIVMGAYFSEERAEVYNYSNVVFHIDTGLIVRPGLDVGEKTFDAMRELLPYKIGIVRGYANTEEFDAAEYLDKHIASTPNLNIRKLFRGRIDMMVGSFDIFRFNAKKEGFCISDATFVYPPMQRHGLHLLGSKRIPDGDQIIADFNRGLEIIRSNGVFDGIVTRFN